MLRIGPSLFNSLVISVLLAGSGTVACSGTSETTDTSQNDLEASRRKHADAGADASAADASKQDATNGDDGTPNRVPCTNSLGSGLSPGGFGRLDGFVTSVISPGGGACNADAHHVHVQVSAGGQTYDVAVNTDSGFIAEKDAPLPKGPWSEGWHAHETLDYVNDLGLHAADFTAGAESTLTQELETALANANHVSVFATTYSKGGIHLVHRHGMNDDGALIVDPLSANARLFAFHFSNQSF
jgi:hypothetical protein